LYNSIIFLSGKELEIIGMSFFFLIFFIIHIQKLTFRIFKTIEKLAQPI